MRGASVHLILCGLAAAVPLCFPGEPAVDTTTPFPGWPAAYEGRALHRIPLQPREAEFFEVFPGHVARFTDGERQLVLRWIAEPTRHLHPASVCFRGRGFEVAPEAAFLDDEGVQWGRFVAKLDAERVRVSERVFDGHGRSWPDVSAWYWSQLFDPDAGPWWAVMVVEPVRQIDIP